MKRAKCLYEEVCTPACQCGYYFPEDDDETIAEYIESERAAFHSDWIEYTTYVYDDSYPDSMYEQNRFANIWTR